MLDPALINFQKLQPSDLPLLYKWLNTDFVIQWYDKHPVSYEEVVEEYTPYITGEEPTTSFLILYGSTPIGHIQTYKIADYPDYSRYVDAGEDAAGVDLFIGEADYLHKGLGSPIIKKFLQEIVFGTMDVVSCIIGPEPANKAAIRSYEKAGFTYLKTIQLPDEETPEYLMRLARSVPDLPLP